MSKMKYKSKKLNTPDGRFDSKKEYNRWLELKALEDCGEITDLMRQVPYELIPHLKIDGKIVERAVKYFADFTYKYKGDLIVEDVKGFKTADYIIKRKLMLYVYGIKIQEV